MADDADVVGRIVAIQDPFAQLRAATAQMAVSQREVTELSRLRKRVIEQLRGRGLSYAQIGEAAGLTRGRIHQIRHGGPAAEGSFFGTGPVTIAVPLRQVPGRKLPVISSEDTHAYEILARLLAEMQLPTERYSIPTNGQWKPAPQDVVAICGPKSSTVTAQAIGSDPFFAFTPDAQGRWAIRDRASGEAYESPLDEPDSDTWADVAYLGRTTLNGHPLLIIAGVHALGSVGAAEYLARHLAELYAEVGMKNFSMVISSEHDGDTVTGVEVACPPRLHP